MRTIIVIVILIAAAGGGAYYWQSRKPATAAAGAELTSVQVARGSIVQAVAATGHVVSNLDVDIKCKASGEVQELPFDISDVVKKGQLLVKLDPIDEDRNVALAQVALNQSKAKLEQARQNYAIAQSNLLTTTDRLQANLASAKAKAADARGKAGRRKDLLAKNLGTQEDYDSADALAVQAESDVKTTLIQIEEIKAQEKSVEVKRQDVELAKAEVEADDIALLNAKRRRADTEVHAPIDGTVSARTIQIGQIISSGITNVGGGTTILTLSDLSQIFVLAAVDESDIGRVALGQNVNITADAHPGAKFAGKVVRIATKGVNLSNVVTFEVKIEIVSKNRNLLKPEMTTNVQVVAAEKNDVLVIPTQAVSRKGDKLVAQLSTANGIAEDRFIEVGMSDGNRIEIASGLREGDTIMYRKGDADSRWRADQPRPIAGPMMMGMPRGGGAAGGARGR
jgi:HlyD family secretion protein